LLEPDFWVIENPVGKMRRMSDLAPFERRTITQCGNYPLEGGRA